MNISPISFGKKIPEIKCKIIDNESNTPINAILYRYDCKDKTDYEEMNKQKDKFIFNGILATFMKEKYEDCSHREREFYSLETENNEVVGIVQTNTLRSDLYGDIVGIDFLEKSSKANYKYIGQSIIASLCKKYNDATVFTVSNPIRTAIDFYTKKCGFEYNYDLVKTVLLKNSNFDNLIKLTEEKTNSSIEKII